MREIAAELIKIAALRQLREAPGMPPPEGAYDEFVARFPYEETEDQAASIEAVLEDLASGQPDGPAGVRRRRLRQDRGGAAGRLRRRHGGFQVAVVVPTTLLARQHFATFTERFKGLPVRIAQASRLVGAKELADVKAGLKDGTIDIVVGTHALLGKSIDFKRLGLLIVDEEQHFGVAHKERLKQLREDVHVLTLTATPIPRTLQLALVGRARAVAHHHAAGRPAGRAHLHLAVRSGHHPRGAAARALPRRADASTSCRASPTSTRSPSSCRGGAGAEGRDARTASCRRASSKTS